MLKLWQHPGFVVSSGLPKAVTISFKTKPMGQMTYFIQCYTLPALLIKAESADFGLTAEAENDVNQIISGGYDLSQGCQAAI